MSHRTKDSDIRSVLMANLVASWGSLSEPAKNKRRRNLNVYRSYNCRNSRVNGVPSCTVHSRQVKIDYLAPEQLFSIRVPESARYAIIQVAILNYVFSFCMNIYITSFVDFTETCLMLIQIVMPRRIYMKNSAFVD